MRKKTLGEPLGIREHEIGFSFISEGSSPHNVNSVQFKFQPRRAVRRYGVFYHREKHSHERVSCVCKRRSLRFDPYSASICHSS